MEKKSTVRASVKSAGDAFVMVRARKAKSYPRKLTDENLAKKDIKVKSKYCCGECWRIVTLTNY